MKKAGFLFFLMAMLICCENKDEKPTDSYRIADGCYEGHFDYRDTSYWCSICFENGLYTEWPSGGAMFQKSMDCLTVGTYSTEGHTLAFVLGSFKFKNALEPCTPGMLLPGRYEITHLDKKDSIVFTNGTGDNQIAYYLKKHDANAE